MDDLEERIPLSSSMPSAALKSLLITAATGIIHAYKVLVSRIHTQPHFILLICLAKSLIFFCLLYCLQYHRCARLTWKLISWFWWFSTVCITSRRFFILWIGSMRALVPAGAVCCFWHCGCVAIFCCWCCCFIVLFLVFSLCVPIAVLEQLKAYVLD